MLLVMVKTTGSEVPCITVSAKDDLDPFVLSIKNSTRICFSEIWPSCLFQNNVLINHFVDVKDLSKDPVSVIQPSSGCGLSILCISSHFYLWEVMNAIYWLGIVLAGVGIIGVGVGGDEKKASSINALTDGYHNLLGKVQGSSFYCIRKTNSILVIFFDTTHKTCMALELL
ncbi:hypothetical protein C5167_036558 [Papaver somniferum]|uniref:Uncharacterized protein n=1 Tax=Papaver somniferum TaxID=3469 RepID=A0A4Y7I875_PAPSO|nr:hypothetical protein C5167_036558 [Papaver somniferum]